MAAQTGEGNMQQNRKILLSLMIGIVFSGAAVYISFRNVPIAELLDYVKTINFWWIIPSVIIAQSTYLVRALRWKIILKPIKRIGFWHAFHPLVIGFTINCILPGRLGELARPAILYKRDNVDFSKVLATVVVERIFDIATLLCLFVFIMGSIEIDPSLSLSFNGHQINQAALMGIRSKTIIAGLILLTFISMFMLPVTRRAIGRFISWLPRLLFFTTAHFRQSMSERLHSRSKAILDNIALGFEVLKNPSKILTCLGLSALVWLMSFYAFYVFSFGCQGVRITFLQASASIIIMCFFIMLPSVPGYWGLWEVGGIYGLMIFGVPKTEAAGLTLTNHFFAIIPLIVIGIFSAWVTGVNLMQAGLHSQEIVSEAEK
jgi:glycosyltransferase 2 family protein